MSILKEKNLSVVAGKDPVTGDHCIFFQKGAEEICQAGWTEATVGHFPLVITELFTQAQLEKVKDEVLGVAIEYSNKHFPSPVVELD